MGSKNGIARQIMARLPKAKHFYDLFAGGCAMTHVAMLSGKYEQYICNDISNIPQLFADAVAGKYANERRWISREDFFKLKDTDPYVACVWSFGNDCRTYMYGKDIEEVKHALHDIHFATTDGERNEAMARYRKLAKGGAQRIISCESLQRLQRLQSLQSLQSDYREIEIADDSVIYCDPPYKGTAEYAHGEFDHDAFYTWCLEQKQPLFISEYDMPKGDFVCIAQFSKPSLFRNEGLEKKKMVIEKLYRPKKQIVGD